MSVCVLKVENLTKSFGKKLVLNNVSFSVQMGEIFGVLGPENSGKSAILRAICGQLIPSNGDIFVEEESYRHNFTKAISYVSGFTRLPKLYGYLTGFQNIKILTSLRGKFNEEILTNSAKIVGIDSILKKKVWSYTAADKQKLCLAVCFTCNPKLIVLDDPFIGLSPKDLKETQDLIKLLANKYKISFVISSQMLGLMEQICDNVAIVNNGSILEVRSIDALKLVAKQDQKLCITTDYPNFAGKIIHNEFKYRVQLCGNNILVYTQEENMQKIVDRLKTYKLSVFNVKVVTKSLQSLLEEVLQRKAMNKSWIEEYN